jgi:Undecaprenyl-phosphate glucose phosphotransferase
LDAEVRFVERTDWSATEDAVTFAGARESLAEVTKSWRIESGILRWLNIVLSAKIASDILRVIDCCAMIAGGWIAFMVYSPLDADVWPQYGLVAVLGGVLLINVLQSQGAYHPDRIRQPLTRLGATAAALLLTGAILIAVAFATKASGEFSRGWAALWLALTLGAVVGVRLMLHLLLARLRPTAESSWLWRNVAIVGAGPEAERFIARLRATASDSVRIVGVYDEQHRERPSSIAGCPVRGAVADLCDLCRTFKVDEIYIAMPFSAEEALVGALNRLQCLPVDIRLGVAPLGYRFLNRRVSYLQQLPMLHVADHPLGDWGRLVKWTEDWVVATVALVLLAPVMLLIAIAIKIDSPGPVLFRQKRYGFNNQLIEVLKFRTMRQDACDANGSNLTIRDDPRVTRFGHFLRRSSLDELPQLINVLRGEMSVVGPRPHAIEAKAADQLYQDVVSGYAARHKMKPGLTGWAQVNGWRGPTTTEEQIVKRVEHDLWYLENWSIYFDMKIIIMTVFVALFGKNAY